MTATNSEGAPRVRASGAVIGIGTHGVQTVTHLHKWERKFLGNQSIAYLPVLAIETAEISGCTPTAGPGLPPVSLPDIIVMQIPGNRPSLPLRTMASSNLHSLRKDCVTRGVNTTELGLHMKSSRVADCAVAQP